MDTTTQAKERPILFSGAMVRALLNGSKTQTRRAVKFPLKVPNVDCSVNDCEKVPPAAWCPYGQPGDRLWVRETLFWSTCDEDWCYQADNCQVWADKALDYTAPILLKQKPAIPSIHMPREASRLLLKITAVRCERLQDISNEDAIAEGCSSAYWSRLDWKYPEAVAGEAPTVARSNYASLWQEINGPESWAANPWVWVVEFKVVLPIQN